MLREELTPLGQALVAFLCLCLPNVLSPAVTLAAPMIMQAYETAHNGVLKEVNVNTPPTASLTVIGAATTEYNNMGWRASDGLLYAVELTTNGNTGKLVTINPSTGGVVSKIDLAGLPANIRFDAGDINNGLLNNASDDVLYISQSSSSTLYILNLNSLALTSISITGPTGYVSDWAYNPSTGILYGMDRNGKFATLNPSTGVRSDSSQIAPSSTLWPYGGAWYNPADGDIYVFRNSPSDGKSIFRIDSGTNTVVSSWGPLAESHFLDGAFVVPLPPSAWLLGTGLLGLGALGWRRER